MAALVHRTDEEPAPHNARSTTTFLDFSNNSVFIEFSPFVPEWPSPSPDKISNDINISQEHLKDECQNKETDEDVVSIGFNPGYRFYFAFTALAVLAMMVALDGTAVSVALPVCTLKSFKYCFRNT